MKLRLDEYYYILNIDYWCEGIEEYMPENIAEEFIKFLESHSSDKIYNYLENLYSYIEIVDTKYTIADMDLDKSYIAYTAIIKINGKYYSFDWYDTRYWNFEDKVDEDIDLIKFKMQTVDETGKILEKLDGPVFEKCTGEDGFKRLFAKDNFIDPACIYLYRREFFIKNKFKYRLRYHEDFGLTSLIIVRANSFVSTNVFGYNYLQTEESLTRSRDANKDVARAKDMLKHYDNMLIQIDGYNIKKETKEMVKKYYTNSVILKVNTLIGEERKEYIKEIRNRKMYKNIKADNIKQIIKRNILKFDINLYLKLR